MIQIIFYRKELSEEEQNKKRDHASDQYKNLSEEEKDKKHAHVDTRTIQKSFWERKLKKGNDIENKNYKSLGFLVG